MFKKILLTTVGAALMFTASISTTNAALIVAGPWRLASYGPGGCDYVRTVYAGARIIGYDHKYLPAPCYI